MTIVEMHVNIDCDGCEDSVRKALLRLEGVDHVSIDRMYGKVTVTGSVSQKKALRAARRSGRLAVLWPSAFNPAASYHHAYAQPAAAYHHQHQYQAQPAGSAHYYNSVQRGSKGGSGGASALARKPAAQYHQAKPSSYNYHVHGYYDSELYGSYHEQQHDVVPVAVRNYFSDENPSACSIM